MFKKEIDDFCAYVADEMQGIKKKFNNIQEKAHDVCDEDKAVSQDIISRLNDLSVQIDSGLENLNVYCSNLAARSSVEYHAAAGR